MLAYRYSKWANKIAWIFSFSQAHEDKKNDASSYYQM